MEAVRGSTASAAIDVELHLGLPSAAPRSPAASSPREPMSSGAAAPVDVVDLGMPSTPRIQDSEPESKRVKIEHPTTARADAARPFTPPPLLDLAGLGMPSTRRNQDSEPQMEAVPGSAAADVIDLEFHLSLPSASPRAPAAGAPHSPAQPKSGGAAVIGICRDLALFTGPTESVADERGSDRVKSEGRTSSGVDALQLLLDAMDLEMPSAPRNQDSLTPRKRVKCEGPTNSGVDGLQLLLDAMNLMPSAPRNQDSEPPSKRVKTKQRTSSAGTDADPWVVTPVHAIRFPRAACRARRARRRRVSPYPPVVAAYNHRALDSACHTEPAWVRAEFLPRHDLPGDLLLHYVGEKVLRQSDMTSRQGRFLFPSSASCRFRAFLSADEIAACGFDCTDRKARKEEDGKRAKATTYAGIPVSVYVSGGAGAGCGVSELRLNKFHRTDGTVINGRGYWQFIGHCGLAVGDGVEVWAFRRPAHRLCFLIAKRDDVCPLDCKQLDCKGSP